LQTFVIGRPLASDQKKAHPRERVGFEVLQKGRRWDRYGLRALFAVVFFVGR
jgi:hypothetical protein